MAVLSDLVSRVRLELGDMPKQFTYTATGDGTTKDFDIKIKPLDDTTLVVTVNGTPLLTAPPTVTSTSPLVAPAGTVITILLALHDVVAVSA